jgi:DNA-binding LacI/PurR family transcriptional regulator
MSWSTWPDSLTPSAAVGSSRITNLLPNAAARATATAWRWPPSEVWRSIIRDYLVETDRPTALFTAQNFITVGATQALHDLELHETIAHVGFDDIELADVVRPGISVVPQHPRDLGRRAAERLFARIEGLDEPPTQQVICTAVVERGSGEIPPYRVTG